MRQYLIALALGLLFVNGAAIRSASDRELPASSAQPVQLASAMIFSPAPTTYTPSNFAYRSDWPSATSYYPGGQTVYYSEHFYDYQGPYSQPNWTYRLFQSYRTGSGYR